MIRKHIFVFCLVLGVLLGATTAHAMYFADFVYQSLKNNDTDLVRKYLSKGYSLDSVNKKGFTALCQAVNENDYAIYRQLRRFGANEKHPCMQQVDKRTAAEFARRYSPLGRTAAVQTEKEAAVVAHKNMELSASQYATIGAIAAGTVVAGVLIFDDDDDKGYIPAEKQCGADKVWDGEKCVSLCAEGQEWVNGQCVDKTHCPEGQHWNGNDCVIDTSCPTGEKWNGSTCVPIVCPENTHLVGNLCVVDGDVDVESSGSAPVYGVKSEDEDVFNIYSSPQNPDDNASIVIKKTGAGEAFGVYGISNVSNSYNEGDSAGVSNPIESGTGNISITSNGSGAAYGLYAKVSDITQYKEAINASGWNEGSAYGYIDITHTGGGNAYGVFGDVRAYNAFAVYAGKAFGDITIHGDGDIYGVSGYVAATNAVSPFFGSRVIGNINLYQQGDKNVYGMMVSKDDIPGAGAGDGHTRGWFAFNAYASGGDKVEGNINIRNYGNGNAYGMFGGKELYNARAFGGIDAETGLSKSSSKGNINILSAGNGAAYGMYLSDDDAEGYIDNSSVDGAESSIKIVNAGDGNATGLHGGKGVTIRNSGAIDINNLESGTAIGIYGDEKSFVENSGTINIHRDSYTDNETGMVYNPAGNVGGTAYGIYAESGAKVVNSGEIMITGAAGGQGIYLADGATLENTGIVMFNGVAQNIDESAPARLETKADFNKMGGEVLLGKGGRFFAEELSGNLGVSKNAVLNSMEKEYVLDGALQADDIKDLNVYSKSAMFTAAARANAEGENDVVLTKKDLHDVLQNSNFGGFLDENYDLQNGEVLFEALKKTETERALNAEADKLSGADVLPNFRQENALVYRHLSKQFNDSLFNRPDENYIGGYKFIDISLDKDGTLDGSDGTANAAYGMLKGTADNGITYGLGATVAQLKTDYDGGSSRKSNIFGLWAPVGYDFKNGTQWYSKLYAGYADGSYDRKTNLGKYSADIIEYQYGVSNELRHKMDLGRGFSFEPLAELNLLGIYQDGFSEGTSIGALRVDGHNSLSLEGGLGAYLTKEMMFNEDNKLGVQIGGVYYVEFLDPDDGADAAMNGMSGRYKLKNKSQDNYAVFSIRANYTYRDLMLYAALEQEGGRGRAFMVDAGVQYKF